MGRSTRFPPSGPNFGNVVGIVLETKKSGEPVYVGRYPCYFNGGKLETRVLSRDVRAGDLLLEGDI